jgi:hypothetical protein
MMDWPRGPSRIVTTLRVFSALDLYIVFAAHDREAAVRSARPRAGQKLL